MARTVANSANTQPLPAHLQPLPLCQVSTGVTLRENNLREIEGGNILESQGILVANRRSLLERPQLLEVRAAAAVPCWGVEYCLVGFWQAVYSNSALLHWRMGARGRLARPAAAPGACSDAAAVPVEGGAAGEGCRWRLRGTK